jgi:hypothetical protein
VCLRLSYFQIIEARCGAIEETSNLSDRAQQAINDPDATPAEKNAARKILSGILPGSGTEQNKPRVVRQNGVTYELQSDGSYK